MEDNGKRELRIVVLGFRKMSEGNQEGVSGEYKKGTVELWLLMDETAAISLRVFYRPNEGVATTLQELSFGVVLD